MYLDVQYGPCILTSCTVDTTKIQTTLLFPTRRPYRTCNAWPVLRDMCTLMHISSWQVNRVTQRHPVRPIRQ